MPARRKASKKTAKTSGKKSGAKGRGKAGSGRARSTARKRPRAAAAPAPPATLADRFTQLIEQAAAGALRRVVDVGGREVAAWLPASTEMRREAGDYLRELRELAGLTVEELSRAIELGDEKLLEAVESGTATLSFELVLRLAAILARHDPLPFISRMLRSYNPVLWQLLEDWGLGRLPLQLERERSFVNILRGHDEARALSDAEFEDVLVFTRAAFEMALGYAARHAPRRRSR